MVLSSRLAAVAALVPSGARLADIGTDHAYLPVSLLLEGRIDHAIAADVRKGPLDHARRTAEEYGVENQLDFRLCDGLAGIRADECDTITIAGMGGETIAGILSRAEWAREGKRLILQPQSTQEVLRDFLSRNGWKIFSESIVREGERWYPVLLVGGGEMPLLSPGEAMAGRPESWLVQPERVDYLYWLLRRTQRQLEGLERSARAEDVPRKKRLTAAVSFLEGQIARLEG